MANSSLLQQAWRRASEGPETPLFTFIDDSGAIAGSLSLLQTFAAAEGIATMLRERYGVNAGDTVLVVHPPGLAFVPALFGCLLLGAIPVPVYPPDPLAADSAESLAHVAQDAGAKIALTTTSYNRVRMLGSVRRRWHTVRWPDLDWVTTDGVRPRSPDPSKWSYVPNSATLLLQYTSGSTSAPRGVEITHANIEHQLAFNREALGGAGDAHAVMWVPQYHDFGLISGILSAFYGNWRLTFLSPLTFLKRPRVWFDTIHRVRATHTAAPDFGYSLAARKIPPNIIKHWDLSCLRVAMTAAEPIREATIAAFHEQFAPARFPPHAFCHAYGLAEHTVGVTVGGRDFIQVSAEQLERGRVVLAKGPHARTLARCGTPSLGIEVQIVDPTTSKKRKNNEVGEVWVHSASVGGGYFRRPEESAHVFRARMAGDDRPWLCTGDLGFLHNGELVICGRAKDVVIIRGRNLYPQDIELTTQRADASVRPGNVIAFSAERDGEEVLVIIAEIRDQQVSRTARQQTMEAIAHAVGSNHGVAPAEIVLLAPGGLPKTTSGKVQRNRCRLLWQQGAFAYVASWAPPQNEREPAVTPNMGARETFAQAWADLPDCPEETRLQQVVGALRVVFAALTGLAVETIAADIPLQAQGADSIVIAEFARTLEEITGAVVPLTVLVSHASLDWLSRWLLDEVLHLPYIAGAVRQNAPGKRAFGGRRRDPQHTRVAILGGGVAGLVAADTLRALGYRHVVVYEANAEVGGKVRTVWHGDRPYEMGQVGFVDSYTRTLGYVHALHLPTRMGVGRPWAMRKNGATPIDLAEAAAWTERLHGFEKQDDAPEPSRPVSEWLERSGAGPLPAAYQLYWTGFGYGYEDLPAAYLLAYLRLLPRISIVVQAEGGNQRVWTTLAQRLQNNGVQVRHGHTIHRVTTVPRAPATLILDNGQIEEPDEVIFACPPWAVASMLIDPEERSLFNKFRALDYRATLIEVDGLLEGGGSLALLDILEKKHETGGLISCSRPYADTNVVIAYQYASPIDSNAFGVLSDEQLDAYLTRDLERYGARLVRIIERARWRYFPHLSPEDHAAGTLDAIEALQGIDGRWFVGSYLNLETVEAVARHASELVERGFGPDQPRVALDRVDDALAHAIETPPPPFPESGAPTTIAQRTLLAARRRVPRLDTARSVVHLHGVIHRDALASSLQRQIERLEGLRLRIHGDDDAIVRRHPATPHLEDGWHHAHATEPFETWLTRFHERPIADPQLLGVAFALCVLGPEHHALAFTIDHLLWDAIGQTWMMRLLSLACTDSVPIDVTLLPTQHMTIVDREHNYALSNASTSDRAYWQKRLMELFPNDEPSTLEGPSDAASSQLTLSPRLRCILRQWSDNHGALTPLYIAAGVLCRWMRAECIPGLVLIDVRSTSRRRLFEGGIEPQQRSFPLGLSLSRETLLGDVLTDVQSAFVESNRHAAFGGEDFADLLRAEGHAPRFLWDVNVFPQLLSMRAGNVWLRMDTAPATHHEHRASFRIIEDIGSGSLSIVLLHRLTEFSQAEGERILANFVCLLERLATGHPTEPITSVLASSSSSTIWNSR